MLPQAVVAELERHIPKGWTGELRVAFKDGRLIVVRPVGRRGEKQRKSVN